MKLLKAKKLTNARDFLEAQTEVLKEKDYLKFDTLLIDTELITQANKITGADEGNETVNAIRTARSEGRLPAKRAEELLNFTILKTADILARENDAAQGGNWRASIEFIQNSINTTGANRELEKALAAYKSNLAADYHNRFAAEWNSRNFENAEKILNEVLIEFPNNSRLLKDRETINK
jgi:hypothetical protein